MAIVGCSLRENLTVVIVPTKKAEHMQSLDNVPIHTSNGAQSTMRKEDIDAFVFTLVRRFTHNNS
ncbi:hypothetical protein RO3G_09624 [Rhizopus delemar RA 99-880]|uniref:Uncharacterized protein n=1 Tax=Rhizopus delemar (strain RA 99-880 / ATCC MYA-4621 / FGSC 9543 / NRRL 43880) TaxID=246409 RepID=I1C8Y4_RHIO9|nr:hypothetical protein RO3G_09624 [Rhizopus delemar RA 99-880]|eukprot:EIE84914.1 hypothetical protein RO3G_09624 [Rhizopus delemar RA 99-880]